MDTEYLLNARGKLAAVEVRINDLPCVNLNKGGNAVSARMNHLVIPGRNEIDLYPSHLPAVPVLSSQAQISAQLTKNNHEVYAHEWHPTTVPPILPPKIAGTFEAGEAFGMWQWQNAPALPQNLPQSGDLHTLFEKMHHAMSAKNVDGVMALLALKNKELAKAFSMEAAEMEESQREFFTDLFRDAKWAMEPLDLKGAKHVFYAHHRIVHTRTHDDKEPLRARPNEDKAVYSLPLLTAHLKQGWTIVR